MELDIFDPIKVNLTSPPESLEFKIKTKKGKPTLFDNFSRNEKTKEEEKYYFEAKKLEPIKEFPNQYWGIFDIVQPFGFVNDMLSFDKRYHKFFVKDTINLYKKFLPPTVFKSLSRDIHLKEWEFFEEKLKKNNNRPMDTLILTNDVLESGVDELFYFREKFSTFSRDDNVVLIELEKYIIQQDRKFLEEDRQVLIEKYDNLDYRKNEENICDLKNLEVLTESLDRKFDYIRIQTLIFLYKFKSYKSYLSSQLIFNCLILSFQKLKKSGVLKIEIDALNSKLLFDILTVLKYYFKEVYLFKPSTSPSTQSYKNVVCDGFKGMTKKDLENLKKISNEWYSIEEDCNTKPSFPEDKTVVERILKNDIELYELNYFFNLEISRKIDVWKDIVEGYYYIKSSGKQAIEDLLQKKVYRSMMYYKLHEIDEVLSLKKIEKSIIMKDNTFDFQSIYEYFTLGEKNLPISFEETTISSDLEGLYEIGGRLTRSKRSLDLIPKTRYETLSYALKEFKFLNRQIEKRFSFRPVSQAFLKMYEILSIFELLKKKKKTHRTFHLCEAPGQFILATNHYLKTKTSNEEFDWRAQSLNPKTQGALKDVYGLIKKYNDRWDFGPDDSGDITKLKNMRYYMSQLKDLDLVTFDCGFGFETKTAETYQDREAIDINFSQILIILGGISKGTNIVLKVYLPQSYPYIISLNYIMYCCFEEFFMYKSLVNPQSSEVYLVGKNFKRNLTEEQLESLLKKRKNVSSDKFLLDIPDKFLKFYEETISKFVQNNIDAITRFNYYYSNPQLMDDSELFTRIKKNNAKNWIEFFGIERIDKRDVL